MTKSEWQRAERVLAVRLDTLGDILMTTPAIRAVKTSPPGRHVTLLTGSAGAATGALVPEVDDVIVYDAPWIKATPPRADSRPDYEMADRLRAGQFDAAVIFTVYSQNPLPAAMLAYLADIPLRLAHCHENPYQLLTDWVLDPEPVPGVAGSAPAVPGSAPGVPWSGTTIRHEVQRQMDLVATVGYGGGHGRLSMRVPAGAEERVRALLSGEGVDAAGRWIVLHPGATAPSRRYSPAAYGQAAGHLACQHGFQIVLTGTGAEGEAVDLIAAAVRRACPDGADRPPVVSLVDRLDLGELAALLRLAPLLISNNSGPVHVAAAMGTPVVDLYALTNPQHTPWGVPHRVLYHDVPCKYCYKSVCPMGHHNCLRLVPPAAVVQAALELLEEAVHD